MVIHTSACLYGELCVLKPLGLMVIHTNFSKSGHSGFDLYQLLRFSRRTYVFQSASLPSPLGASYTQCAQRDSNPLLHWHTGRLGIRTQGPSVLEKFVCITTRPSGLLVSCLCLYGELRVLKPLGLVVIHSNFSKSGHSGFDFIHHLPRLWPV